MRDHKVQWTDELAIKYSFYTQRMTEMQMDNVNRRAAISKPNEL